ncbi:hypothetical protein CK203_006309 [Vitis vinifera]|uniref:Ubiquitin-like protease family profile domain-containing protein n=1 Tax=Vitis vinifera TaxID=29760 RepID=A0A438KB55_VITVI|nr:hypothetical protein CK203_006309 [Vitis vinifera]
MIIKNRSKGVKLVIKYNPDGIYVGQAFVHLTSFLGVLARTMVPIRYNSWRDVPIQVKNNLWDTIEASFTLDSKSRRNCMLTMGKCFRSFKNMLTVKYVIPFKDQPEDKMLKESRESGRIFSGNNDILTEALGTPEYSGRMMPSTPQSDISSSNVKKNQIVLPQAVEQPKCQVDDHVSIVQKENKVRKCQLAIGTKENVVAAGTIILECGVNFLVVVDASYEPNAPLPVPIPNQITTIGEALGYQVLWPAQMVSLTTHPIQMVDAKMAGQFAFLNPALVSKAGMGEASKESSYHWVLVALETRTMIAYYLDSLEDQPSNDLKEIVNMALRIHPPQKHKSSKREPTWVVVGCPIQPGSVEYGYYVMRYMRDIIADQGCLTSKNVLVGSKGNMKISNFGHGVIPQHCKLHRHPHKT